LDGTLRDDSVVNQFLRSQLDLTKLKQEANASANSSLLAGVGHTANLHARDAYHSGSFEFNDGPLLLDKRRAEDLFISQKLRMVNGGQSSINVNPRQNTFSQFTN